MRIQDKCMEAGVVGAGGAGFPAHVKLNSQASVVLANGAECEPLLRVDQQVMMRYTEDVIEGMRLAMEACGAKEGKICIKAKHKDVIEKLEAACTPGISVFLLNDYYPAGDEQQMVYDATGRVVPVGGIPLDAGVVVQNTSTLRNVALAMRDIPVTHKHLTIAGEVKTPMTIEAPLGMTLRDCIRLAGGPVDETGYGLIVGGPMMGYVETNWDNVVTKTTGGLIVLPADHAHYIRKAAPRAYDKKLARSVCCQCMLCTQMCPRNLLGLGVEPHKAMRALAYGNKYEDNGVFSCCNCGVCSYFACPFGLAPSVITTDAKNAMSAVGKRPEKTPSAGVAHNRQYAKVPVKRLIGRLGLKKYDVPAPLYEKEIRPEKVSIRLRMHIGAPCTPVVQAGEQVACGQVIATIEPGKLGVNIHASITGTVQSVDGNNIVII